MGTRPLADDEPALTILPTEEGIAVSGDVDLATWTDLSDGLRGAADRVGPGPVVLDVTGLSFIDGHGVGMIVAAAGALGPATRLVLRGVSPALRRLVELLSLDGEPGLVIEGPGQRSPAGLSG